jgi:hypothetical protein
MNQLPIMILEQTAVVKTDGALVVPATIAADGEQASWRYIEFSPPIFEIKIRADLMRAPAPVFAWCESRPPSYSLRSGRSMSVPMLHAHHRGAENESRRSPLPRWRVGIAATRKRRQAACHPLPPRAGRNAAHVHRCRRHRRREQGLAVSHLQGMEWGVLSEEPMNQADAWRMVRRRAKAAGIKAPIGCHTFRATGITAYLENGGTLEHAQAMAAHESPRTTKLCDRTKERLTLDEIERIRL